jgi:hypothetical protein
MKNTEPSTINCFLALCNVKLNELIMALLNIEQVRDRGSTQHTVSRTQPLGQCRDTESKPPGSLKQLVGPRRGAMEGPREPQWPVGVL